MDCNSRCMILRPLLSLSTVLNKPGKEASLGTLGCYLTSECYVANNRLPPSALYKFGSVEIIFVEIILVGIQKILALHCS